MNEETEAGRGRDPYAPPASDLDVGLDQSSRHVSDAGLGAQTGLVQALTGLLGLQALLQGLNAVACLLLAMDMLELGYARKLVSASHLFVAAYPVVYYIGIIPFALFLVGTNKNARAFLAAADTEQEPEPWGDEPELWGDGPKRSRTEPDLSNYLAISSFSPASMFWWFCVPFLNFVRPYQAVKAVWACSAPQRGGLQTMRSDVLSTWWVTWMVSLFASRVSGGLNRMDLGASGNDVVIALVSLLSVGSCLCALRMVRALHYRQRLRAAELWA